MKILLTALFISLSAQAAAKIDTSLALNWKPEPEFAGFYTAQINKTYEKNNLNVKITEGGAGTPTAQMLASGQVDFGIVSGDELLLSRQNGAELVALFAVFQTAPYAIMTHEEAGFKDIKDLFSSNTTVAVVKGLPYIEFLQKKYSPSKVKLVPYTGGISSFISDKNFAQQCFVSSEPLLAAQKGLKTKTFMVADSGFNPYTVVLAARKETIEKKPELVKSMLKSVRTGWTDYLKDSKATHELIAKLNPSMTVENMNEMHKIEAKLIETADTKKTGLGSMTDKRWSELSKQMFDLGLTKTQISTDSINYKEK
ncbi:MAG: ABC transporter substrate-binding protein [Pseudobdellovibrio sp.]